MAKRFQVFLLCFCLAFTLIPLPVAANADGYGVSKIMMDGSLVGVTYFCADKACLAVTVYDAQTNQMTAVGSKTVEPNKEMALISLSGTIPEFYSVSAFLLDSENFAPLCEKYTVAPYARPAPNYATYFNGHAYKVYEQSMTWIEARTFCEALGGHLAVITSQEEQDFIESAIKDGSKFQYWLGATDELVEDRWEWVNGEEWDYANWDINMPDNGGYSSEHYLQIYREPNPHVNGSQSYKWNDITIDNVYSMEPDFFLTEYIGFICEWENAFPIPDAYFNGHAYKVYEQPMTWSEARTFCEALGGHLAVITSQEEQDFIERAIKDGSKFQYWLGATDELAEGRWEWVNGEEWDYANWDINMPDNGGYSSEHYLQIYREANPHVSGSQPYKWNDITIDNVYSMEPDFFLTEYIGFICEWETAFS